MGNQDSYVGLDCVGCNKTYSKITWDDWREAGTILVYRGYCHSCCGGSVPHVSWSGNVVKLGCKASGCNKVYGVITWATWKISGTVWRTRGYCSECYEKKKSKPTVSSITSGLYNLQFKTIHDVPSENRVYEFAQKYVSVAHSSIDPTVGYAETDLKSEENIYIPLEPNTKATAIVSPNSIIMRFQNHGYKLQFGLKGSSVHVAISRISFKGSGGYRTYFHFGIILAGNTYNISGRKNYNGNYMLVHLLSSAVCVNICKSRKMCFKALNQVWGNRKNSAYCCDRRLGHSVLSAKIITEFLIQELHTPYEYGKLKTKFKTLDSDWPKYKLNTITNCYLFGQRFCKLLNRAHSANNDIKLPNALSVVLWSIGKQEWYEADKFFALWKHGKKNT